MDVFRGRINVGGSSLSYVRSLERCAEDIVHQKDRQTLAAYEEVLGRRTPESVLEIGIADGGSLLMWRSLWPKARVVGVDCVAPGAWSLAALAELDIEFIHRKMPTKLDFAPGSFDMIVDDGAHGYESIEAAFALCWPLLRAGGIYVVEDWHLPAFEPGRIGGLLSQTVIGPDDGEFFCDGEFPPDSALRVEVRRRMIVVYRR
jgi:predicted O-methyltransferase YrrM